VSGKNAEQVAVDERAERLGAVAVIAQAGGGKDRRPFQTGRVFRVLALSSQIAQNEESEVSA
jgi:hypothetical protein